MVGIFAEAGNLFVVVTTTRDYQSVIRAVWNLGYLVVRGSADARLLF